MPKENNTANADQLSDYERAICYYTIPRVIHPTTLGLLIAYAVCILEALIAFIVGIVRNDPAIIKIGAGATFGIVVLGIVIFMYHALINDFRQRKALAVAKGIPNALPDIEDVPDPFAGHILLKCPRDIGKGIFNITDNKGDIHFKVETAKSGHTWDIFTPEGEPLVQVRSGPRAKSFFFDRGTPNQLGVFENDQEVAKLTRRFSLKTPKVFVEYRDKENKNFFIEQRGIHYGDTLIGRVYYLRKNLYLDVKEEHFNYALLAFLVALT